MLMAVVVRTSDELKKAMDNKSSVIYVEGELAQKIKKTEKLKKLSGVVLATVIGIIIAIPFTGGTTAVALAPVALAVKASSGVTLSTGAIIAIVSIGAGLVLTMYKDYDVDVEYDMNGRIRVVLKRK